MTNQRLLDAVNDDLLYQMMRGKIPTGFESLTNEELVFVSEHEPPENCDGNAHAIGLLVEMCKRFKAKETT